jgi:hypothetical protein
VNSIGRVIAVAALLGLVVSVEPVPAAATGPRITERITEPASKPLVELTLGQNAEQATSTTTTSSTSGSLPFEIEYSFRIGLYSPVPVTSLRLELGWGNYLVQQFTCSGLTIATASDRSRSQNDPTIERTIDFGSEGLGQSQRILRCFVSVFHEGAHWNPSVVILDARDRDGQVVDVSSSVCLDCGRSVPKGYLGTRPSDYDDCGLNLCGDAVVDGLHTSGDALKVLAAAVGLLVPKYTQPYDVNADGKLAAIDALRVLRRAVGLPGSLSCPKPPAAQCGFPQVIPALSATWAE